ncbi:MAG: hypothetical protein FJW40_20180 [Acidobacteria bacterium]|nr:hypothetical protein [Acidobacteriota bacterium]
MQARLILLPALTVVSIAAELPVRTVVLYKHGVGFFERSGELRSGEGARLDFKATDMNDVLKSLTIVDKSGKVTGLRYDSSEPLERKLADFPFKLTGNMPLAHLVDQLKGARIALRLGQRTVEGAIVGARIAPAEPNKPERELVTVLADAGGMTIVDLAAVTEIRFPDPAIDRQIKDYMAALTSARSKEKKSLYIDSTDDRARAVSVAYMLPSPVWKSSYRLVFPATGDPVLEGWAIVDNTTGEDWTKVNLALVSGRPVSFLSRLYEPVFRQRQYASLPEEEMPPPVVHMARTAPAAAGAVGGVPRTMETIDMAVMTGKTESTVAVNTAAAERGELFEYRFNAPVTVRKSESAMLPFLQEKITARKLLIYSDTSRRHPMNAAELTNSTGKTLDGGPITAFDGGVYAGEALMETFKANDKRLISYATDLGTVINITPESGDSIVRELKLNRGLLTLRSAIRETTTYAIRNIDAKPKTLIVEHPFGPESKVISPKPVETTNARHRFEVKLAPSAEHQLAVVLETHQEEIQQISSFTPDQLEIYLRNPVLTPAARRALEQIAAKKRDIATAAGNAKQMLAEIEELDRDQQRTRQNIGSLNNVAGQQDQVQRYARQLAERDARLDTLRAQAAQFRRTQSTLESELNGLIESAAF